MQVLYLSVLKHRQLVLQSCGCMQLHFVCYYTVLSCCNSTCLSPGKIEVSRSFGDLQFKRLGMSAKPAIQVFGIKAEDKFLICGCDGFWSCFSPQDAVQAVAEMHQAGKQPKGICDRLINMVSTSQAMHCMCLYIGPYKGPFCPLTNCFIVDKSL